MRARLVNLDGMDGVRGLFGFRRVPGLDASLVTLRRQIRSNRDRSGGRVAVHAGEDQGRGRRLSRQGRALSLFGLLLLIPAALVLVADRSALTAPVFQLPWGEDGVGRRLVLLEFLVLLGSLGVLLVGVGAIQRRRARHVLFPSAKERLAGDRRPPIVFLRSFRDDRLIIVRRVFKPNKNGGEHEDRGIPFEIAIGDRLEAYGPFVAIGDPRKEDPRAMAARAFVDDDHWRQHVMDWLAKARMIVILCAPTDGLLWEIEQVAGARLLDRTLFLMPPSPSSKLLGLELSGPELEQRRGAMHRTLSIVQGLPLESLGSLDTLIAVYRDRSGRWVAIHSSEHIEGRYELAIDLAALQLVDARVSA